MKKKVLILMAEKTGSGHKSSANAIKNSLSEKTDDIEVVIFNAFELMGKIGAKLENSYNKITAKAPFIWKLTYEITNIFNSTTNYLIYKLFKKRFSDLIEEVKPDLIISVHPMFNNPVAKAIKKFKFKIPFFVYIIDLVKISRLWHSKNADMTFCPTSKVQEKLTKKGFKREKVITSGFPISKRFTRLSEFKEKKYTNLKVLMVSPSTKNKKTLKFSQTLIDNFNIDLTIVTGSNKKLYGCLQENLRNEKVKILNYVDDMPEKLKESDILITKAGPNMMLEAVRTGVPVIVTGHILGQEEKNYKVIVDNNYGFKCESARKLKKAFESLEKNDYKMLNEFRQNQINSTVTDGADFVTDYIINYFDETANKHLYE